MFGFVFTHGYLSTLMLVFYECECNCLSYLPCLLQIILLYYISNSLLLSIFFSPAAVWHTAYLVRIFTMVFDFIFRQKPWHIFFPISNVVFYVISVQVSIFTSQILIFVTHLFDFPIYTSIGPHKHVFVHPSTSSQYTHISVFECPIALPRGTNNAPCFKSLDIQL